ncbi:MAG: aldose 1-epimerase [Chitinophagaceae bacterium]|nr:aldose 1-epimerase [Chitinophagaceae bacterium]
MQTSSFPLTSKLSGQKIFVFRLKNKNQTEALISNYGAIILSFKVKQANGSLNDIVLGFEKPEDYSDDIYLRNYPLFGAAEGRYGNRIKDGKMEIDGKKFQLPLNMGADHLHGGISGFDKKIWELVLFDEQNSLLEFKLKSPDGDEGYPGNLDVSIKFRLNDHDELSHEYHATTDQPTAVNLTHHSYFNLNNGTGNINDHFLKIHASAILEQDSNYTTTGNYISVQDTSHDFRNFHTIAEKWGEKKEYDQSFVIDKKENELGLAAEAYSTESKIKLDVLTTEPVVHLYTGSGITALKGKQDTVYGRSSGFCLETQKHPNAINIPHFPKTVLRPGQTYYQKTIYRITHI